MEKGLPMLLWYVGVLVVLDQMLMLRAGCTRDVSSLLCEAMVGLSFGDAFGADAIAWCYRHLEVCSCKVGNELQ